MNLPKIKTQAEELRERMEAEGFARTFLTAWIGDLTGNRSSLPEYGDPNDIERRAAAEFRRHDFSEASNYVDSLVKIAEHYKELAQTYHHALSQVGAEFNEWGGVDVDPAVVTRDGKWVGGTADLFELTNEDDREAALKVLQTHHRITTSETVKEQLWALIQEFAPRESDTDPETTAEADQ